MNCVDWNFALSNFDPELIEKVTDPLRAIMIKFPINSIAD